jgi:hypothetical protein
LKRSMLLACCGAAAGALLLLAPALGWASWPTGPRPPDALDGARGSVPAGLGVPQGAFSDAVRTEASVAFVRAVSARTAEAIPQATLTLIAAGSRSATLVDVPTVFADAQGRLMTAGLAAPHLTKLVRAPGFIPAAVSGAILEPFLVELQPGGALEIAVQDEDAVPVADACILLSRYPASRTRLSSARSLLTGIGHPLVDDPVWVAASNSLGVARLDELPMGEFRLNVVHPRLVPRGEAGHDSLLTIGPGLQRVACTMRSFHAAVFRCPSASAVRKVSWIVRFDALDKSPAVVARLGLMRETAAEKFPECLVYAHMPMDSLREPLLIRCTAVCEDDSYWVGEWPLTPIGEIREPCWLEQHTTAPMRQVSVVVRDATGAAFDGIPVVLSSRTSKFEVDLTTGEPAIVPCGSYDLAPRVLSSAIWSAFKDRAVEIDPTSPAEIVVTTDVPLVEVIVTPILPTPDVLGPLTIYIENQDGKGPATANWIPERGPVRRWLAARQIKVRVTSMRYQDVDVPVREVVSGQPVRIDVPLIARAAK